MPVIQYIVHAVITWTNSTSSQQPVFTMTQSNSQSHDYPGAYIMPLGGPDDLVRLHSVFHHGPVLYENSCRNGRVDAGLSSPHTHGGTL